MSNIQKAFKAKAKRGLCMAVGGIADPSDLIQNPTASAPQWSGGFKSMDHDAMADMNSLSPSTQPAGNPFYGGAFGNDPRMTASNNPATQRANVPSLAQPRRPAPNMMTPVEELIPSRRGLQMADGGIVETPEQVMARMAAKYGVSSAPQEPSPVPPAPAPAPQPAQPSGGLFQGAVRTLRGRAAQIDKTTGYAQGGVAVVKGPGTGTSDDIPVTLRSGNGGKRMNINVSNGEGLAVLPAKTMQHPEAIDAVNTIIATTNGKPPRGLKAGASYAVGTADLIDNEVRARAAQARVLNPTPAPTPTPTATAPGPNMAPELKIPAERPATGAVRRVVDKVAEKAGYSRAAPATAAPVAQAAPVAEAPLSRVGSIRQAVSGKNATTIGDVARKVKDVATGPRVAQTGVGVLRAGPVAAGLEGAYHGLNTDTDDYYARTGIDREATHVPQVMKDLGVRGLGVLSDVGASAINGVMLPANLLTHGLDTGKWYDYRDNFADVAAKKGAPAAASKSPTSVPETVEPGAQERTFSAGKPGAAAPAPTTAAQADVPNAPPANDIQRRTIRGANGQPQTEFYGKDVKQTYTGADGKPTTNWEDTKDYKDSQIRAKKDQALLRKFEEWGAEGDRKSLNPVYQARGLARQAALDKNVAADVAREQVEAERGYKAADLEMRREDLGLRRAQEARALAGAQFDRENKILETQRKATEDMDKDEEQAFKAYSPMFTRRGKDGQGNEVDLEDKDAHAAFINAVRHTMAQRGVVNPVNGKPLGFGSLNKAEQDRLFNRYNAVQRLKGTMGPFPWNADKVDSLNLDDFDAVQNKDGTLSFPKLEARMKGRSIRARQKDFEYTEPSKWYDPFQTPDNTMLMNLLSKRG